MPWPKGKPRSQQTREKLRASNTDKRGDKNPAWKGGLTITSDGYVMVKSPEHPFASRLGYVREHRLVMERHLGRFLERSEHVHHINGNKSDNRIENLELVTPTAHQHEHHKGAKRSEETRQRISEKARARWKDTKQTVTCAECATVFPRRGRGGKFCSVACSTVARQRRGWHPPGVGAKISAAKKRRQS